MRNLSLKAFSFGLRKYFAHRRGFTLLQILVVISIIAVLSALLLGSTARARESAQRAQCNTNLSAIALALDAYKQDNNSFPAQLSALQNDKYLTDPKILRCPNDPQPEGKGGYEDFYVIRSGRDSNHMPLVVCPFHEDHNFAVQAFTGRETKQYTPHRAHIAAARNATILRPGKSPIAAATGMELRGGDTIVTGGASASQNLLESTANKTVNNAVGGTLSTPTNTGEGEAVIEFTDGSTATLGSGTKATVLQSFLMGQAGAPLYTLIRQSAGQAIYKVHSGSKFDVATPTATSGARGTEFKITVKANGETELYVIEGKVAFTTLKQTVIAPLQQTISGLLNGLISIL